MQTVNDRRSYPTPTESREIELPLNRGTLNDLIAAYLISIGVIRYSEEVTDITLKFDNTDLLKLTVRFEPDIQVI